MFTSSLLLVLLLELLGEHLIQALRVAFLQNIVSAKEIDQRTFILSIKVPVFDEILVTFQQCLALCLKLSDFSARFVPQLIWNAKFDLYALVDQAVECAESLRLSFGESCAVCALLVDVVAKNLLAHVIRRLDEAKLTLCVFDLLLFAVKRVSMEEIDNVYYGLLMRSSRINVLPSFEHFVGLSGLC